MNGTAFKRSAIWRNIAEIAVVDGTLNSTVYQSAHFGFDNANTAVPLSLFT